MWEQMHDKTPNERDGATDRERHVKDKEMSKERYQRTPQTSRGHAHRTSDEEIHTSKEY